MPDILTSLNKENNSDYSYNHNKEGFRQFLINAGIEDVPYIGAKPDEFQRFGKDGKYSLLYNGDFGYFKDWSGEIKDIYWFLDTIKKELTFEEKEALNKKIEQKTNKRKLELKQQYEEISLRANNLWKNLAVSGNSSYLSNKKKLSAIDGIKFGSDNKGNFIATALIDNDNKIWSLQFIYDKPFDQNKNKLFLTGGKKSGCYSKFSNKEADEEAKEIFICEGLATGLSILLAKSDSLVIVAYDCYNLKEVTRNIILKYPDKKIIIAGDNDISKEKNIGKEKAEEVAKEFDLDVVLPTFKDISNKPSDFYDLRQLEGVDEVKIQLNNLIVFDKYKTSEITKKYGVNQDILDKNFNYSNFCESLKKINPNELEPIKQLDVDNFLPSELGDFIKDVAYRLCVPAEFVAIPLIAGFSSLIAGKIAMKPKTNDNFCIFPNLWGGLIGNPSTRKSDSLKEALFFFSALENMAGEEYQSKHSQYQKDLNKYKIKKQALEEQYKSKIKGNLPTVGIENELDSLQEPTKVCLARFKINEATTQKITEILKDNPSPSILLERDELAGFLSNLEKKENEADRAYFLEMWNGNTTVRSDTIGRGSIIAKNAAISIIGTTQPDKIKSYLQKAFNGLNDGLLQRFQLLVYPDFTENEYVDEKPNEKVRAKISNIANFLNDNDFFNYSSGSIEKYGKSYPYLSFNPQAQEIYKKWHNENNKKVNNFAKQGKNFISQHLSKYHKLLPAISLIFHLVKDDKARNIDAKTLSMAICFCGVLESHAKRIYSILDIEDQIKTSALEFIEKIKNKIISEGKKSIFLSGFTKRDIKRKFSTYQDEELEKILNILLEHNYLAEKYSPPAFQRKETYSYFLNQNLIKEWNNE